MISVEYACQLVSEANRRDHWAKVATRKKQQRLAAWAELRAAGQRPGPGRYVVTITRIGPRKLDGDNLQSACKATRDGIADWLGIDDGSEFVAWRYAQEAGKYGVRITVEAT